MTESDAAFPSGPWTGFFTYQSFPGRHRTDLILEFASNRISGEGNDGVGSFVVSGHYDVQSRECYWTKTYVGAHDVFYRGFREGKGIWGTWEIGADLSRGGFHIWPIGEVDGSSYSEKAHEPAPAKESRGVIQG
jgi:hypothetical protein